MSASQCRKTNRLDSEWLEDPKRAITRRTTNKQSINNVCQSINGGFVQKKEVIPLQVSTTSSISADRRAKQREIFARSLVVVVGWLKQQIN